MIPWDLFFLISTYETFEGFETENLLKSNDKSIFKCDIKTDSSPLP